MEICTYPSLGYDCEGNINIHLGDEAFGVSSILTKQNKEVSLSH